MLAADGYRIGRLSVEWSERALRMDAPAWFGRAPRFLHWLLLWLAGETWTFSILFDHSLEAMPSSIMIKANCGKR